MKRCREVFIYSDEDDSASSSDTPTALKQEKDSSSDPTVDVKVNHGAAPPQEGGGFSSLLIAETEKSATEWEEDLHGAPSVAHQNPSSKVKVKVVEADNGFRKTKEQFEVALETQARQHPRYREWLQREDFLKKTLGVATLAKARCTNDPTADGSADDDDDDDDNDIRLERLEVQQRMKPVVDEESGRVLAVETMEGYRLTVDERELLDLSDDEEERGMVSVSEAALNRTGLLDIGSSSALLPEESFEDEKDDEEEEEYDDEEEEERMDALVTVAVAQRLVECFQDKEHFDELEPQLQEASVYFLDQVVPLFEKREALMKRVSDEGTKSEAWRKTPIDETTGGATEPLDLNSASATKVLETEHLLTTPEAVHSEKDHEDMQEQECMEEMEVMDVNSHDGESEHNPSRSQGVHHFPSLEEMLEWRLDDDKVFAKAVDYPLRRVMRIHKMIRRPPREPNVVIDGVEMDF